MIRYLYMCLGWFVIFLIVFMILVYSAATYKPLKLAEFEYSDLDNYYLECMSKHHGTGKVGILRDGSYNLICADGHSPYEPHKSKNLVPFIKSTPGGKLSQNHKVRWLKSE